MRIGAAFAIAIGFLSHLGSSQENAGSDIAGSGAAPPYETLLIRGRIVWLSEALLRRFGLRTVPEAKERVLALETRDGQLYPIAEDIRGRAFRKDERLRNLPDCELLVRQYKGSPVVQVIRLFSHENGQVFELDYYCDICAITMFELKPCDCCQGPIQLRRRPVQLPELGRSSD